MNPDRINLINTRNDHKLLKRLGAYYDWRTHDWYIYKNMSNISRFDKWMPKHETQSEEAIDDTEAVTYSDITSSRIGPIMGAGSHFARREAQVLAGGNKWQIENWYATH